MGPVASPEIQAIQRSGYNAIIKPQGAIDINLNTFPCLFLTVDKTGTDPNKINGALSNHFSVFTEKNGAVGENDVLIDSKCARYKNIDSCNIWSYSEKQMTLWGIRKYFPMTRVIGTCPQLGNSGDGNS
ncbi:MAG: hypothetical protein IPK76_00240 [Lewinellaceae bacterium]|nr:hypothetical protein [Lewinellaceae bacterium]